MKNTNLIVVGIVVLLVVSIVGLQFFPYGLGGRQGFVDGVPAKSSKLLTGSSIQGFQVRADAANLKAARAAGRKTEGFIVPVGLPKALKKAQTDASGQGFQNQVGQSQGAQSQGLAYTQMTKEGFRTQYNEAIGKAAGAKDSYEPIGAYDDVTLSTGNSVSKWRFTSPDEPLIGAEFEPGEDSLFMFKNNQCKPECCGSSFSCSGGCVCTTPKQRQYIASRGNNRTSPQED